jgi:hypothetical protein
VEKITRSHKFRHKHNNIGENKIITSSYEYHNPIGPGSESKKKFTQKCTVEFNIGGWSLKSISLQKSTLTQMNFNPPSFHNEPKQNRESMIPASMKIRPKSLLQRQGDVEKQHLITKFMQNALNKLPHDLSNFLLMESDALEENQNQQSSVILDRPSTVINEAFSIETVSLPIIRINSNTTQQFISNVDQPNTSDSNQEENRKEMFHQLCNYIISKEEIATNQRAILLENLITVIESTHQIRYQLTGMKDGIICEHKTTKF